MENKVLFENVIVEEVDEFFCDGKKIQSFKIEDSGEKYIITKRDEKTICFYQGIQKSIVLYLNKKMNI